MSNENKELAIQKDISDNVLARVNELENAGGLKLPPNYVAANSLKLAFLNIMEVKNANKQPALEVCTKQSVSYALLEMVTQGLNPAKKQCYFIVHGNKLTMMKSYFGTIAIAKRSANVKDVFAVAIYKNDVFKYSIDFKTGNKNITQHDQEFESIDDKNLLGAYAIVIYKDESTYTEIMTMAQIKLAWAQGVQKGNGNVHNNFPAEMAKKTVITRALKIAINSSDDADLFTEDENEVIDTVAEDVQNEVNHNANQVEEGFTDAEITDGEPPKETVQAEENKAPEVDPGF